MTSERRPDDDERQIGALARSLAETQIAYGLRLEQLEQHLARIDGEHDLGIGGLERRVLELEAHMAAVIAQTAETELTRRAVRELIGRVDALEFEREIVDHEFGREIVDLPIVDDDGAPI